MPVASLWWPRFFVVAALFNYVIGLPIFFASAWSYGIAYNSAYAASPMALRLWSDFGFGVVLIGFGYQLISYDVTQNRGIVLLGIIAKLFDVCNLTYLYHLGIAKPVVLLPASIDGAFVIFFVVFWLTTRQDSRSERLPGQ